MASWLAEVPLLSTGSVYRVLEFLDSVTTCHSARSCVHHVCWSCSCLSLQGPQDSVSLASSCSVDAIAPDVLASQQTQAQTKHRCACMHSTRARIFFIELQLSSPLRSSGPFRVSDGRGIIVLVRGQRRLSPFHSSCVRSLGFAF